MSESKIQSAQEMERLHERIRELEAREKQYQQAEQTLRKSEQTHRHFVESFQGIAYQVDLNTSQPHLIGGTIEQITGYPADEFMSGAVTWNNIVHPDDRAIAFSEVEMLKSQPGYVADREYRLLCKDGSCRWVRDVARVIKVGSQDLIQGTAFDVSDRKKAEDELENSQRFLDSILEQSPFPTWISDTEGTMIRANSALKKALNLTDEQLVGQYNIFRDPQVDEQGIMTAVRDALERGKPADFSLTWRGDDAANPSLEGSNTVHCEGVIFPIHDAEGVLTNAVITYKDVTARKEAEEELLKEKKFSETAVDCLPGIFYLYDDQGNFLRWNHNLETVSGYSSAEISQMAPEAFFPPDERDRVSRVIGQVFTKGWASVEANFMAKDGSLTPYLLTGARLEGEDRLCLVGMGVDISARKRAEQERLSLERQVQHAQKLESLGVLAGGIAHDFNNLLTGILGNADLALRDLSPESSIREYVDAIEAAARRAADLAKQMLAYSGKGKFAINLIDIQTLIEEMVHLLKVSISKQTVINFDFAPDVPAVEADATQIRQIVMNLVVNAAEAVREKKGVLSLRTGVMDCDQAYLEGTGLDDDPAPGRYSYFEVSDSGHGMDEETVARIFDPFFTTKFTGRGLGLAAVLGIVRGHNGTIKVYSKLGEGTTFRVLLPAAVDSVYETEISEPDVDKGSLEGKTLLLVDDEETVRAVGKRMLANLGLKVVTAEDGRQALTIFKTNPEAYDVVVLDLTMPHMDGEETFHLMRSVNENVPIILSSGYSEHDLETRFAAEGFSGFIQKPYNLSTLQMVVSRAITGSGEPKN